jgi:hypothetical protein
MGWESQAVKLVAKPQPLEVLNHANNHAMIEALDKFGSAG